MQPATITILLPAWRPPDRKKHPRRHDCQRPKAEAGVGWFDLSGNAHIVSPPIRVIVEEKPNRFKAVGRPRSLFAPKSSRIVRWLLVHAGEFLTQRETARATGLDEGGSWQVGVDWERVLPPWFRVLSATAAPGEYAERITALLDHQYNCGRDKMLAVARKTATPEQRKDLADAPDRQASRRRGGTKS